MQRNLDIKLQYCKNYKYCIFNIEDNSILRKFAISNNNLDIEENIDKKLAILFKKNINIILNNNKLSILTLSYI